ncbi:17467_t:CDS:2 [Rhizophagus irregularis]|nr:17467_t:CDS:2 [Rhizophagus irregularis]
MYKKFLNGFERLSQSNARTKKKHERFERHCRRIFKAPIGRYPFKTPLWTLKNASRNIAFRAQDNSPTVHITGIFDGPATTIIPHPEILKLLNKRRYVALARASTISSQSYYDFQIFDERFRPEQLLSYDATEPMESLKKTCFKLIPQADINVLQHIDNDWFPNYDDTNNSNPKRDRKIARPTSRIGLHRCWAFF